MGKANQQRRRMKAKARKRRQPVASGGGSPFGTGGFDTGRGEDRLPPAAQAEHLISVGVNAVAAGDAVGRGHIATLLAERPPFADERGRVLVSRVLTEHLLRAIGEVWRRGWQPADLGRVVGREMGAAHGRLVSDVMAADLARYAASTVEPAWAGQLAALKATAWWPRERGFLRARLDVDGETWAGLVARAIELLRTLLWLPTLARLCAFPGEYVPVPGGSTARADVDERILERVRALLAKAESTPYPAEAETFTCGAQALMARHSIDAAMLAATAPTGTPAGPGARRVGIDNPYDAPKAMLLGVVAGANRCRAVWSRQPGFSTVIGHSTDLDAVELLFTSLLVQATSTMMREGARIDRAGRSRTRSFRQSFLTAYAHRIGERLADASGAVTESVASESGRDRLLPVLAAREQAVDAALAELFPELTHHAMSRVTNAEGWASGRSAADRARLTGSSPLPAAAV